ncbi:MAG: Teichoic acids export ATP-binding protein TagH [Anaerolineales bacterium]|nr:Teichoic acids export ATP-binding protein TagH [Anaerolineales bacterium]
MTQPAIRFENVSKKFVVHHERPRSFQEVIVGLFRDTGRHEELWAVRDVSFTVARGEALGLIGPNGSGKSTLLKLVSRILEPTAGDIEVNGRLSALLELGAGFHPDLTGRENIYLNGSILGLSRREMNEHYADIVRFSEMERFIDMPVKHYSSGMAMRLGFAVAIHVEPDVLLIDEILAVGDESFQMKCLDKIDELRSHDITIVFVSHTLDSVRDLCDRALWLENGEMQHLGPTEQVIDLYRDSVTAKEEERLAIQHGEGLGQETVAQRWGSGEVEIVDVRFQNAAGNERHVFRIGESMTACIHYRAHKRIENPAFGVAIHRSDGLHVNGPNTKLAGYPIDDIEGEGEVHYAIESLPLLAGTYQFSATCYDHACAHPYDHHHRMYTFRVQRGDIGEEFGAFYIPSRWEHQSNISDCGLRIADLSTPQSKPEHPTSKRQSSNGV